VRLTDDPGNQLEPSWSRDGKWIYCGSSRTGRLEIHRVPAGGGRFEQITRNGGLHAEESFDGKWLFYSKDGYSPTSIWKVPRDGGEESRVIEGVSYSSNFVPIDKGIYFTSGTLGQDGRSAIEFYEFATGRAKALATMDKSLSWGLALSPDGRFLLHPLVDRASSNLMLVENFR
jgi:Tol biopolymer transport system component